MGRGVWFVLWILLYIHTHAQTHTHTPPIYLAVEALAVPLEEPYSLLPLLLRDEGPGHVAAEDDEARLGLCLFGCIVDDGMVVGELGEGAWFVGVTWEGGGGLVCWWIGGMHVGGCAFRSIHACMPSFGQSGM